MRGVVLGLALSGEFFALAVKEYLLSSSAICPSGTRYITTAELCLTAAQELSLANTVPETTGPQEQEPSGCYRGPASQLYFNPGGSGASTAEDKQVLCEWQAEAPENEQLGYLGTCDPLAMDTDLDHVNIPVREMADVPDYMPSSFDARTEWPYCFELPPRSQGACGSCWAFAVTSVARQRACVQDCKSNDRCDGSNVLSERHFSVQHVMGCSVPGSRRGCDGGTAADAYNSLVTAAVWEHEVPYKCGGGNIEDQFDAGTTSTCTKWPWGTDTQQECGVSNGYIEIVSFYQLPLQQAALRGGPADMMAAELAANGPLAVDFCVRVNLFSFWKDNPEAVYLKQHGCDHGQIIGGHMVMLVGFGVKPQTSGSQVKYWIAQNSWGDSWGDAGFFKLQRGVNLCGIENKASAVSVRVSAELPPNVTSSTTSSNEKAADIPIEAENSEGLEDWVLPLLIGLVVVGFCCWFGTGAVLFLEKKRFRERLKELQFCSPLSSTPGAPPTALLSGGPAQQLTHAVAQGPPPSAEPGGQPSPGAEVLGRSGPHAGSPWPVRPPPPVVAGAAGAAGGPPQDTNPFRQAPPQFPPQNWQSQQQPRPPMPVAAAAGNGNPFRPPQQVQQPTPSAGAGAGAAGGPAAGSQGVDTTQSAPPWWFRQPEAYVDNVDQRTEEEKRKNMYG